jgi:hypothetical protein
MFFHTATFRPALRAAALLPLLAAIPAIATEGPLSRLAVSFEENQGQFDPSVRFLARRGPMAVYVTGGGSATRLGDSLVAMRLEAARDAAAPRGLDRLAGVSHYYRGADPSRWQTGIPHFARVEVPGVYPGVDLIYHGSENVEYDFAVHPGADPGVIAMRFEGGSVSLSASGDLLVATASGTIVHRRPTLYQETGGARETVDGGYDLRADGTVGFRTGDYRHDLPLVIDPVITYSTFLGGNSFEQINGVAVVGGEAVVVGTTASTNFPTMLNRGFSDIFVARLNAAGTALVYAAFYGGSAVEEGLDIAFNPLANELAVVGTTSSEDFPGASGSFQSTLGGSFDAVVIRLFVNSGTLIRSTYYGGSSQDDGLRVAVDSSGAIVIAGNTISTNLPLNGATDTTLDNSDGFLARFTNGLLILQFGTYLGGSSIENVWALATDNAGNAVVGGNTLSGDFPVAAAYQSAARGNTDGFLTRFNLAMRNIVSSTYIGGTGSDVVRDVVFDSTGALYITGETDSGDFPLTPGTFDTTANGSFDIFALKMTGATLNWGTLIGGTGTDIGAAIALGPGNSVALAGSTNSSDFPTLAAPQPGIRGRDDVVAFRLNAAATALIDSTFLGGTLSEVPSGLAYVSPTSFVVAGTSDSSDYPVSTNAPDIGFGGDTEGFVTLLSDGPAPVPVTFQSVPSGATVIVDGARRATPFTVQWTPGVNHSVNAPTLQYSGGQTLTFSSWSGTPSSSQQQTFLTPAAPATYIANFSAVSCTYTVSPAPVSVPLSGGPFNVFVSTQPGCAWTASSGATWITGGASTVGPGVVTFNASVALGTRTGAVSVAFRDITVNQVDAAPRSIRSEPASGTGTEQVFRFIFEDASGSDTISIANVLINSALDGRQSCYLAIIPSGPGSGNVVLVNDAGDAGGPFAGNLAIPGTGSISNSNCAIDGTNSSIIRSGPQLLVNLRIRFLTPFRGSRVIYLAARDTDSNNSGWAAKGIWSVPGLPVSTPAVVSLTPAASAGSVTTFTATFSDDLGPLHLNVLNILVNDAVDGRNACYIAYIRAAETVVLVNDAGAAGGPFAGAINIPSLGTASNSQCTVDADGSSAVQSGRNLILTLRFIWKPGFRGDRIVYLAARDIASGNSGWVPSGVVNVP